ncbi:hypothetical protein BDZ94DRAFT_1164259 [Collybia nuda]|uniref:Phosphatidate cytidylyltransferase n=1 Tax=Collybia nuda TaxID=64659 RepID=A0A9P5Y7J0_9AGAR|nr:hypothetical protein BDZ94DRAFT_1164259 [Collybia nuda]
MTVYDSSFNLPHDPPSQTPPVPRRRRALSTASTRSSISVPNKRSPSPRVTFTVAPLSSDAKGVKNITRKVIRTLEGLGHLDSAEMHEQDCESDNRLDGYQVASTINGSAPHPELSSPSHRDLRHHNVSTNCPIPTSQISISKSTQSVYHKIDWEIPRKILHSSIGFFTVYLYISEGDVKTIVVVLWTALSVIVPADILRLRYPRFERVYERCLGFLMRESEKKSVNGVVWYILGVNFVLSFYPQDVATVAILILSWANTAAASTIGRLFASRTPPLPSRVPFLGLPFAPRKSLAGFTAATLTGAFIAVGFWGWIAPIRNNGVDVSWSWSDGVRSESTLLSRLGYTGLGLAGAGGWPGLGVIGLLAGLVSGVAEALDLGSLDDNLTLPIISGGCILGFLKLIGLFSSPPP